MKWWGWLLTAGGVVGAGALTWWIFASRAHAQPTHQAFPMRFAMRFVPGTKRTRIQAFVDQVYDQLASRGCFVQGGSSVGGTDATIVAHVPSNCVGEVMETLRSSPIVASVDSQQCMPGMECDL